MNDQNQPTHAETKLALLSACVEYRDRVNELERENAALRAQDAWLIATFGNREDENAALRAELEAQAVVNGKGGEREAKLLAENAALRTALNDFRSLSFIALLAPVPDCRPHYDLVKKHWALLNNESTKEAQP